MTPADSRPVSFLPENQNRVKGTRPPRSHAEKAEVQKRVRYTVIMIVEGQTKGQIKNFFKKNWSIKPRQVERYIKKAREQLADEVKLPTADLVAQSYGFYMNVLQDDSAPIKEKLRAREQADKLLGLNAPKKIAHTDAAGKDLPRLAMKGLSDAELETILKAEERLTRIVTGASGSSQN